MSLIRSIFSRKTRDIVYPGYIDFSSVRTDIHSHLIPGIDDGVKTMEESVAMIRAMAELGFKKLVTTPHIMSDYFRNTPEIIHEGLLKVREQLEQNKINIQLDAAAEYYLDEDLLNKIQKEKLLTIGGRYLLFEISYMNPPDNLYKILFELNIAGYTPILAHPERYPFWYEKFSEYEKVKEAGALFQLNTNSLMGYYGPPAKKIAEQMIDANMIDFLGSDLHGQRHLEALQKVANEPYFGKLLSAGVMNSLL